MPYVPNVPYGSSGYDGYCAVPVITVDCGANVTGRSTLKWSGNDWATIKSITLGGTPASANCLSTWLSSANRASVSTIAASTTCDATFLPASVTSV